MLDFLMAVIAFLMAQALWDFTKRRAHAEGKSPLAWIGKMTLLIAALAGLASIILFTLIYLVAR